MNFYLEKTYKYSTMSNKIQPFDNMSSYSEVPSKPPTIFIEGLGDVYVPERNTEQEIRNFAKLVLSGEIPADFLEVRTGSVKSVKDSSCRCKEPCFCHPNKWSQTKKDDVCPCGSGKIYTHCHLKEIT